MGIDWRTDPRMGMVIGMTLLFFCLVGPIALLVPLAAWLWMRRSSPAAPEPEEPPPAVRSKARRPRRRSNLG